MPTRLIKDTVEGPPRKLVEAVAEDIAERILKEHALILNVQLRICKPHVAIEGVVDFLGELSQNAISMGYIALKLVYCRLHATFWLTWRSVQALK